MERWQRELAGFGYSDFKTQPDGKILCIARYLFTYGLLYNIDHVGFEQRWCYKNYADAKAALDGWDGEGDPPGPWLKSKGQRGEYSNTTEDVYT